MRKFIVAAALIGVAVLTAGAHLSYASEVDVLIQKLVEKGILNASEAQEIRSETNEAIVKEEKQKREDYKAMAKDTLPSWVKSLKLKGDFRFRYELVHDKKQSNNHRARIRARLGIEAEPNEKTKVGIGIATGKQTDPRSTNVTLGNDPNAANTPGSAKTIILDYAYGEYAPAKWIKLTAGRFYNPLWRPSDLLWDSDVNPEGIAVNLKHALNPKTELFFNHLGFVMRNDDRNTTVPYMMAFQPGINLKLSQQLSLKGALTYYKIAGPIKGKAKFSAQSTNSLVGNNYRYNYDTINPSLELTFTKPFESIPVLNKSPYLALFGDYVKNVSGVQTGGDGFDLGLKFGQPKVEKFGQWQGRVMYAYLGRDSWLDIFPDSDRFGGKTNIRSIEALLTFGLGKNTNLELDFYSSKSASDPNNPQYVTQADWNLKF